MLNLKEIRDLIKLCRKEGIKTVKHGDLELTLGDKVPAKARKAVSNAPAEESERIPTAEEMQFWSAQDLSQMGTDESN